MNSFPSHIVIAPIMLPLLTGALLLFFDERQRFAKAMISLVSCCVLLLITITLCWWLTDFPR
jgi:multicomponent K+:H+ antiporter subunit D